MNLVIIIFFIYIFPSLFSCDNYIIFKKKKTLHSCQTQKTEEIKWSGREHRRKKKKAVNLERMK